MDIEWSEAAVQHMARHGVTPQMADEAAKDPASITFVPDYNSKSGQANRIIGYSETAGRILSIIVAPQAGKTIGLNGWPSNSKDRRHYREGQES